MSNLLVEERPRLRAFQLYVPPAAAALAALEGRSCRWPMGEVESEIFRFCGAPCGNRQYCQRHGRLAVRKRR